MERNKELGLNYFDNKYDVKVSIKSESQNSSQVTFNKEHKNQ